MILALIIGLVVLASAMALTAGTWRSVRGVTIRDGVTRNARYLGVTLQRDVQETGVDLSSAPDFGPLATFGDTIAILRVPYAPAAAPQYALSTANFANGVCGVDVSRDPDRWRRAQLRRGRRRARAGEQHAPADLRHVDDRGGGRLSHPLLQRAETPAPCGRHRRPGGHRGRQLRPAARRRRVLPDGVQLMRATRLERGAGSPGRGGRHRAAGLAGALVFTDGSVVAQADSGSDGNAVNDYDDIAALRCRRRSRATGPIRG